MSGLLPEWPVYSMTGTRNLLASDLVLLKRVINALPARSVLCTGGCVGTDAAVARLAVERGSLHVHTVLPANRAQVDPGWQQWCHTHEAMPSGTTYRQRNQRLVALIRGGRLLAFPDRPEFHGSQRRSGTWMTVRIAHRAGKPVDLYILH